MNGGFILVGYTFSQIMFIKKDRKRLINYLLLRTTLRKKRVDIENVNSFFS